MADLPVLREPLLSADFLVVDLREPAFLWVADLPVLRPLLRADFLWEEVLREPVFLWVADLPVLRPLLRADFLCEADLRELVFLPLVDLADLADLPLFKADRVFDLEPVDLRLEVDLVREDLRPDFLPERLPDFFAPADFLVPVFLLERLPDFLAPVLLAEVLVFLPERLPDFLDERLPDFLEERLPDFFAERLPDFLAERPPDFLEVVALFFDPEARERPLGLSSFKAAGLLATLAAEPLDLATTLLAAGLLDLAAETAFTALAAGSRLSRVCWSKMGAASTGATRRAPTTMEEVI